MIGGTYQSDNSYGSGAKYDQEYGGGQPCEQPYYNADGSRENDFDTKPKENEKRPCCSLGQTEESKSAGMDCLCLLPVLIIYFVFAWFWVLGQAFPLEHDYFVGKTGGMIAYAVFMVLFGIFYFAAAYISCFRLCNASGEFRRPQYFVLGLLLFTGFIGAPFIAAYELQKLDYKFACVRYNYEFYVHPADGSAYLDENLNELFSTSNINTNNGQLIVELSVEPAGFTELFDLDPPETLTWVARSNAGGNMQFIQECELLAGGDFANATTDSSPPNCTSSRGTMTLGRDKSLTGNIEKELSFKSFNDAWLKNPIYLESAQGERITRTAVHPDDDAVKVCANTQNVVLAMNAIVARLQPHIRLCDECMDQCLNECVKYSTRMVSYSCGDGKKTCWRSETYCSKYRSKSECISRCQPNSCAGVLL